jgi:hypothetical protein
MIVQVMQVLSDYLKTMDVHNEAREAKLKGELKTKLKAVTAQSAQLQILLTMGLTFEVKVTGSQVVTPVAPTTLPPPLEGTSTEESQYMAAQSSSVSNYAISFIPTRTDDAPEP